MKPPIIYLSTQNDAHLQSLRSTLPSNRPAKCRLCSGLVSQRIILSSFMRPSACCHPCMRPRNHRCCLLFSTSTPNRVSLRTINRTSLRVNPAVNPRCVLCSSSRRVSTKCAHIYICMSRAVVIKSDISTICTSIRVNRPRVIIDSIIDGVGSLNFLNVCATINNGKSAVVVMFLTLLRRLMVVYDQYHNC